MIIISYTKIISIKLFCIQKKIEIETCRQINKPSNIFFFRFTFSTYIPSDSTDFSNKCIFICIEENEDRVEKIGLEEKFL